MTAHSSILDRKWPSFGSRLPSIGMIFLLGLCCTTACADDQSVERGAKQAGRATGSALHDIGHGAKTIGIEIGHAAADAGKEIGRGAATVGRTIGHATREGATEFRQAIKGDD